MAEVTVLQLAEKLSTPMDRLLRQMDDAGLPQRESSDHINDEQQALLLQHLQQVHGEAETQSRTKITLKRREVTTLRAGRTTVNVQVRKKRTYVRRPVEDDAPEIEAEVVEEINEAPSLEAVVPEVAEPVVVPLPEVAEAPPEPEPEVEVVPAEPEVEPEPEVIPEPEPEPEPVVALEPAFPERPLDPIEAVRRAAHAKAVAEEENRREVAAQRVAEREAEATAKREQLEAKVEADAAAKLAVEAEKTRKELEESKVSDRKDKRDRHDLDDTEQAKAKRKSGGRKRKLDVVSEMLAEVDDDGVVVEGAPVSSTLALSGTRTRRQPLKKVSVQRFNAPTADIKREVEIGETVTVAQLSQKMSVKAGDLIKTLMGLGVMANINQTIDQETATLLVEEFGHTAIQIDAQAAEKELVEGLVYEGDAETRAPVVTVMGHVDHGKTSLLDYIRKAAVVDGESGGITQHIGAYRARTEHGDICFIDTPGHAAFSAMRARGADCTDVVILVVAANDGVMPQTEEAVKHAKSAGVPMVVALNKMDVEGADPERVKNELAARDVIPEDWGGDTQFIQVSAITGMGVEDLLEAVLLQAEVQELTAVPAGPASGVVLESQLDKGKGVVATLLVQNGTLKQGDVVVAGQEYGRVRAIHDESGAKLKSAGPSTPVSILGLSSPPGAGDTFLVAKNDKKAREVADQRKEKANSERLSTAPVSLDSLLKGFGDVGVQYLNIVLKVDARGSLEAITTALQEIGNDEVKVNVVSSGVGAITESDADYALTAGAVIFGFNVRADSAARRLIEREELDLRYYNVIYDIMDDVKAALSGMLSPETREEIVGIAEVRDVFDSKKYGQIAGCLVTEGTVSRSKKIRVLRSSVVIYEGELESLRHFKEEVADISRGSECGIGVRNYNDVRRGDQIEVFDTREVARNL